MRFIAFFLFLVFSCSDAKVAEQLNQNYLFQDYLKETFPNKIETEDGYFLVIGKRICVSCEHGVFESFKTMQKKINHRKITLITDYTQQELDTLLIDKFEPNTFIDSTSNFENYTFPRSYVTIYKLIDGKLVNHVYLSDINEITDFIEKENLQ